MSISIEPSGDGGISVYSHGTYGRESVLEGQPRRQFVARFDTLVEAQAAYPDGAVLENSSKPWQPENATLEELSGLPSCPPAWFDPADAGETW